MQFFFIFSRHVCSHKCNELHRNLDSLLQQLPSRLAQLVERKTLNLVVVGSSPTVGGLFVYFDGARNERHDPVSTTARGARLHAREVQGGRLKICWAKVRLGSNPSAGKTFLARVAFWRAVELNNQSNNVDELRRAPWAHG